MKNLKHLKDEPPSLKIYEPIGNLSISDARNQMNRDDSDEESYAGFFKSLIAPWSFIEWEKPTPPPRLSHVKKLSREE